MAAYLIFPFFMAWLLPPGCNIFLMLAGISLQRLRPTVSKILMALGIGSFWLMSTPIFAYTLINILQNQYPPLPVDVSAPSDNRTAIVVLGAGSAIQPEKNNRYSVTDLELNRLRYAAWLHKKTGLPLIVSGGPTQGLSFSEADLMQQTLQESFDVSADLKEGNGLNTAGEAAFMQPLLRQHHIDSVYLVTNAWHMPRSVSAFKRRGISVIPAPMGFYVYDQRYSVLSFMPNMYAFFAMSVALHEYIGLLQYRFEAFLEKNP